MGSITGRLLLASVFDAYNGLWGVVTRRATMHIPPLCTLLFRVMGRTIQIRYSVIMQQQSVKMNAPYRPAIFSVPSFGLIVPPGFQSCPSPEGAVCSYTSHWLRLRLVRNDWKLYISAQRRPFFFVEMCLLLHGKKKNPLLSNHPAPWRQFFLQWHPPPPGGSG